ncbi:hypothetical protein JOD29_002418 [Lysinibacillus composti]|nr:hypothetical protein [Lysinibacillus composti]
MVRLVINEKMPQSFGAHQGLAYTFKVSFSLSSTITSA